MARCVLSTRNPPIAVPTVLISALRAASWTSAGTSAYWHSPTQRAITRLAVVTSHRREHREARALRAGRRVGADVDDRRLTGRERALERGADVVRPLDELAVAADALEHRVVAGGPELPPDRRPLRLACGPPRVVRDDAHDRD